jgi:hypothetical protein
MKVLMHAIAASCEELRARTGNPPLHTIKRADSALTLYMPMVGFHFFKRRGGKISSGVRVAPLSNKPENKFPTVPDEVSGTN